MSASPEPARVKTAIGLESTSGLPSPQVKALVRRLRTSMRARHLEFWTKALGEIETLPLPKERVRARNKALGWVVQSDWIEGFSALRTQLPDLDLNRHLRWHYDGPPLHLALATGSLSMVQALLGAGADPNRYYDQTKRALNVATRRNNLEQMRCLLAAGANPSGPGTEPRGPHGVTSFRPPLLEASSLEALVCLMDAGAELAPDFPGAWLVRGLGGWLLERLEASDRSLALAAVRAWRARHADHDPVCVQVFGGVAMVPLTLADIAFRLCDPTQVALLPPHVCQGSEKPGASASSPWALAVQKTQALQRLLVEAGFDFDAMAPSGEPWRAHALRSGYPELREQLQKQVGLQAALPAADRLSRPRF